MQPFSRSGMKLDQPACQAHMHHTDRHLSRLLTAHNLCALNTWNARPAHTHTHSSHTGCTQIDFLITRCATASQGSKLASPIGGFPVAGWRIGGHLPLQAPLSILPVHWRADIKGAKPVTFDKIALQTALSTSSEQAQALQLQVKAEVSQVPTADLHLLHQKVNHILCRAVQQAFPPQKVPEHQNQCQCRPTELLPDMSGNCMHS